MNKEELLRIYLYLFGFLAMGAIPLGSFIFGDALLWAPRNVPTEMMMNSIFVAMGLVMILIAKNPLAHKAFVDFLILSNISHALVMLIYAQNVLHVFADVAVVGAMEVLPLGFYPWGVNNLLKL